MTDRENIDIDGQDGGLMSGVFRWKASHALPSLPTNSSKKAPISSTDFSQGWAGYFSSISSSPEEMKDLMEFVQSDLAIIDCLSFPITVTEALVSSKLIDPKQRGEELHIVCIGTSAKAEERVLRETTCWEEIRATFHQIKTIHVYLVGPEMSKSEEKVRVSSGFVSQTFKGTSKDFFKQHKHLLPIGTDSTNNTVVIGMNCGFGNFGNPGATKYDLLHSWYGDLSFLTSIQSLPCIFTCANDYEDVTGETMILAGLLGANFIAHPRRNEFSCASTFVPPHVELQGRAAMPPEYSCGNSYWYGVQGSTATRRVLPRLNPALASMPAAQRCREMGNLLGSFVGQYNTKSTLTRLVEGALVEDYASPLRITAKKAVVVEPEPEPEAQPLGAEAEGETVWECVQKEAGGQLSVLLSLPQSINMGDLDVYITTAGDTLRLASADSRGRVLAAPVLLKSKCQADSAAAKYSKKKHVLTVTALLQ